MVSATPSTAIVPVARMFDDLRYGRLAPEEKRWIEARVALFERIDAQRNKRAAFAAEARRVHAGERWSESTIRKAYYAWVDSGRDWWAARNRRNLPGEAARLPEATVRFWHERCADFGAKHAAAWRSIERDWQAGMVIPGFEGAPRTAELPRGLSYENLMRDAYRPTEEQDAVAAIGPAAAAQDLLPGILTTRVGLHVGQRYVFDDMWHDFKVTVPGQIGARRLLQFHCLDLLSACQIARGVKPEILNDRTGRMERLKESELLFLLAHVLGNIGYHPGGCGLMMEHGTASVPERVEKLLHDISGGKIRVLRGGIGNSPLAPGLFAGRSRGNFKFKAALESLGNLIHNETSDRRILPIQTGSMERLNEPEDSAGRKEALALIQTAARVLPPALRDLVRYPAPPLGRAMEALELIQERINERTEHAIEDWAACGHVIQQYRLHAEDSWHDIGELDRLPELVRAATAAAIEADPRLARARSLSPREVFDGHRADLVCLRPHHLPALIGMEHAKERAVGQDGRICFDDLELGDGTHVYDGICRDDEGHAVPLPRGEKFAGFASTLDPRRLHLCDAKGRYVGWVQRESKISRGDTEAFARAAGAKIRRSREALAPALADARRRMKADSEDAEINAQVFGEYNRQQAAPPAPKQPKPESERGQRNARRAQQLAAQAEATLQQSLSNP